MQAHRTYNLLKERHRIYIYALVDPLTQQARYVGRTAKIDERLHMHIQQSKKNKHVNENLSNWILDLISKDERPEIVVIATSDFYDVALLIEILCIKQYAKQFKLFNINHN